MTRRLAARLDIALAGALAVGGYVVAAFKLAALSWDGSWYLFRSLQDGSPFIPHLRYGTYPILWVIVEASKSIRDPRALGVGYGLLLALFPLGSLALSWYFLRGERLEPLRIWPTLGILLTPLPGQFCLMSEATPAAQLLWPILAIIAAGPPGIAGTIWLALLSAELCCLHPTAAIVFALAAGLSGCWAWHRADGKMSTWIWTGIFAALAIGKLILALFFATDYERSQVSGREMLTQFFDSIMGPPLFLLAATYLLGVVFLAASTPAPRLRVPSSAAPWLCALFCAALALVGFYWADYPAKWRLLNYRRFVLPATLPLVAFAILHHRRLTLAPGVSRQMDPPLLSGVSAVFAGILITQSLAWGSLLGRFTEALSQRPAQAQSRFMTPNDLAFTQHTALQHWTACPLSLLLQGREPHTMFVLKPENVHPESVQVNPWEQIPLTDRWLALQRFEARDTGAR